jgi:hypothetical protein
VAAIDKMESSVGRDIEELNFQNGKVNTSFGQLEAQIRQAKVAMIEERVRSKKEKLAEMYATKTELDRKMEQLQEKEKRKADEMLKEDAKKAAQEKIAGEIAAANAAREKSKDSLFGAAAAILGDSITDMVDTVKAVAEVVEDRIEDKIDEIKEIWNDKKEEEEEKVNVPLTITMIIITVYIGLGAFIPPKERRGLVLIDPPFEQKDEISTLLSSFLSAYRKWPTGIYVLWYPIKNLDFDRKLCAKFFKHNISRTLRLSLNVGGHSDGLKNSGLLIINPPFTLEEEAHILLPFLTHVLAQGEDAEYQIDWVIREDKIGG